MKESEWYLISAIKKDGQMALIVISLPQLGGSGGR